MYKIIGADKKEYGPVTAAQMRQWLAEGRVNAQTSVQSEGAPGWKPLFAFAEFADVFTAPSPAPQPAPPGLPVAVPPAVVAGRDYELDIGKCIGRSWALVQRHFWPIVGINVLVLAAMGAVNQIVSMFSTPAIKRMVLEHRFSIGPILLVLATWLVSMPISSIFIAGLFRYYLKLIRGEPAGIGDAFSGFGPAAGQLILLGLVSGLLTFAGIALCILPAIYLSVSWMFAIPLVIDRRMDFWEAMELSRQMVSKHWFTVFAFLLVNALVGAGGIILCCIGILVTLPLSYVAWMYAYEDIFGHQTR